MKLHIALVTTDYPPQRTSAAVQMHDLAVEMQRLGHTPVLIIPTVDLATNWAVETADGVSLLRIRAPQTRDISYVERTFSECLLPFLIINGLRKSPFARTSWDLVAWYSPTIFFGPLIWYLKRSSGCRSYLILRDIFPEWAVDLGLMRKGLVYSFFKAIAHIQYAVADTIGVQSKSNLAYMESWHRSPTRRVEVLDNWQTPAPNIGASIDISSTSLAGRKIAVYIGNMGVAQGMDILLDLAEIMQHRDDIGFLFVGRGSEVKRLKERVRTSGITNTLFFDEVDSGEMPGLLSQCFIGLLALDPRHKTHNIPGKFLTYLYFGLPVLARVNQGTDLMQLINNERVGKAFDTQSPQPLQVFLESAILIPAEYESMSRCGRVLAKRMFSAEKAANQIIATSREVKEHLQKSAPEGPA